MTSATAQHGEMLAKLRSLREDGGVKLLAMQVR